MNLYFVPASETGLRNNMFEGKSPYRGGVSNMDFWHRFAETCRAQGVTPLTFDYWKKEKSQSNDVLFVQNHPGEPFLWRTFYSLKHGSEGFLSMKRKFILQNYGSFGRRVLWQGESPMVVPYIYRHLDSLRASGIYQDIFLLSRLSAQAGLPAQAGRGPQYRYFNYFDYRGDDFIHPSFDAPKEKFLVMVNTNAFPHSLTNEFYGERLRAIKYFNDSGLDLYGYGWDKVPRHPFYMHYSPYIRNVFRGEVKDKVSKLSEYRFAICFENCAYPGYVSEKIFDCLAAGTIPVYLGAPDISKLVPENCFIDFRKFSGYLELYRFLASRTEQDLLNYRTAIKHFLATAPKKTMDSFVQQVATHV